VIRPGFAIRDSGFQLLVLFAALALVAGCRQDMHNQPKYRGLRPSTFFADGSSARPLVEGTVARGSLRDDEAFFTGKPRPGRNGPRHGRPARVLAAAVVSHRPIA
jgi:hypothetical protein